jgi:hypothetical protein
VINGKPDAMVMDEVKVFVGELVVMKNDAIGRAVARGNFIRPEMHLCAGFRSGGSKSRD